MRGDCLGCAKENIKGNARFIFPGSLLLSKTIRVPHVEEERQRKIVAFALMQKMPVPLTDLIWDYQVIDDDGGIRAATDEEVENEDPRIRGILKGEPLAALPRKLNLNNLTFHLPFDKVEYEPEQFPGLIYRLDYPRVVCLIFGSGKMVITGARHKDEILEAVEQIKDALADLL